MADAYERVYEDLIQQFRTRAAEDRAVIPFGSIGTAIYRSEVAGTVPADVPPAAAEAARDTLGGAVAAADELPVPLGAELLDSAREAFTQALQLTAITSAAVVLGMAILAAVLLRHVRPSAGTAEADEATAAPGTVDESR